MSLTDFSTLGLNGHSTLMNTPFPKSVVHCTVNWAPVRVTRYYLSWTVRHLAYSDLLLWIIEPNSGRNPNLARTARLVSLARIQCKLWTGWSSLEQGENWQAHLWASSAVPIRAHSLGAGPWLWPLPPPAGTPPHPNKGWCSRVTWSLLYPELVRSRLEVNLRYFSPCPD